MRYHELKLRGQFFHDAFDAKYKAVLRKNDRDFKTGDLIHFVTIDGKDIENHENNLFIVTYVYDGTGEYGLAKGYCILSIELVDDGKYF